MDAVTAGFRLDDEVELDIWRVETATNEAEASRITLPGSVAEGLRGIWLLPLDDTVADWLAVLGFTDRGVLIAAMEPEKPARAAGLRHLDVVTHVNDERVTSVAQLRSVISSMLPGAVARLRLWRFEPERGEGRSLTLEVQLDRLDTLEAMGMLPREEGIEAIERLGFGKLTTSTPELASRYRVRYRPGVLVESVLKGSRLEGVIEPGSIIVAVGDTAISDRDEFFDRLDRFDLRPPRGARIAFLLPNGDLGQTVISAR
jgi:serine protease Do